MATDYLNQPLECGSIVVLVLPKYADITIGVVLKLTAVKAHVAYMSDNYGVQKILTEQSRMVVINNDVANKRAVKIREGAIKEGWLPAPDVV